MGSRKEFGYCLVEGRFWLCLALEDSGCYGALMGGKLRKAGSSRRYGRLLWVGVYVFDGKEVGV